VTLEIQSVGLPPEQHANRVTAELLRDLARKRAQIELAIGAAIESSKDGNPKAQAKMAERIRRAGAEHVSLTPGKRGRYEITIYHWTGWDSTRDQEIRDDSTMPQKPWIACQFTHIETKGRGRGLAEYTGGPLLLVTHHALSRAAQRFGIRTGAHMIAAVHHIWNATADLMIKNAHHWTPPPLQGLRVPLDTADNAIVVLKQHESRLTLIAATIFSRDNFEHNSEQGEE
jgi:hypothetical protein